MRRIRIDDDPERKSQLSEFHLHFAAIISCIRRIASSGGDIFEYFNRKYYSNTAREKERRSAKRRRKFKVFEPPSSSDSFPNLEA